MLTNETIVASIPYQTLTGAGKADPYFSKEEFVYDPELDLYYCPAGNSLGPRP